MTIAVKEVILEEDIPLHALDQPVIVRKHLSYSGYSNLVSHTIEFLKHSGCSIIASRKGERETREFSLDEYLVYMNETSDENPWYASNLRNSEMLNGIMEKIELPASFSNWLDSLPQDVKPPWLWLFMGPASSSTALHIDVMMSSAWNLLLSGTKKWRFLSPAESIVKDVLDDDYADEFPSSRYEVEVLQFPGDLVFTPSGWAHEVINLEPTMSVTGNFINESNVHLAEMYLKKRDKEAWIKVLNKLKEINRLTKGSTSGGIQ
ncbi:cupin-like domain-containing protein [Rossellomorea sp. AcN35-11]|nr:cupin-like domain-containing protein [Rossellomorea aquimaris]WJV30853.1 cupin-like domain-containing protein [Rossellomorea sp. AcN35-11]